MGWYSRYLKAKQELEKEGQHWALELEEYFGLISPDWQRNIKIELNVKTFWGFRKKLFRIRPGLQVKIRYNDPVDKNGLDRNVRDKTNQLNARLRGVDISIICIRQIKQENQQWQKLRTLRAKLP